MFDGSKIPDLLPDDVWKPRQFVLSHEEWRAVGLLSHLFTSRLVARPTETARVMDLAETIGLVSKTFASLRLTNESRCGMLLAVAFCYMENAGLAEIEPSFLIVRPANQKFDPMNALVRLGPRLASEEQRALYKALTVTILACSIGESAPGITEAIFKSSPPASK